MKTVIKRKKILNYFDLVCHTAKNDIFQMLKRQRQIKDILQGVGSLGV